MPVPFFMGIIYNLRNGYVKILSFSYSETRKSHDSFDNQPCILEGLISIIKNTPISRLRSWIMVYSSWERRLEIR